MNFVADESVEKENSGDTILKKLKKIPKFKSEREEQEFWSTHDSTEYIDYIKGKKVRFPNLKPSLKTILLKVH